MKKFTTKIKLIVAAVILLFGSGQLSAQHEILVPSAANFYDVIMGDTIERGDSDIPVRRDPEAVYLLKRGDVYKVDRSMVLYFNLTLIGEEGDDATSMPAVLVPQKSEAGQEYPDSYINVSGDNLTVTIKNLIMQGVPSDYEHKVTGTIATLAVLEKGDNCRMIMDKVVITGFKNAAVQDESAGGYAKFTNCTLRNIGEPKDEWGGTGLGHWVSVGLLDTLIVQNCTFFNVGCGVIATTEIYAHVLVEHNTFFGSITGFGSAGTDNQVSAISRNNILFSAFSQGLMKSEKALWGQVDENGDLLGGPSVIGFDTIRGVNGQLMKDSLKLTEEDRVIALDNNLVWWPESIVAAWDTLDKDGGAIIPPKVISTWGEMMVEKYPMITVEGMITEVDPEFDQVTVDRWVDIATDWVWNKRRTSDWPGYYRLFDKEEHMYRLQWPLPEDLAYNNAALGTASTDGLHLGDLNWFPDDKKKWDDLQAGGTGVKSIVNTDFELTCYPNPFTNNTTIEYAIYESSPVTLSIINMLGKEVVILVDQEQLPGNYSVNWDGSDLVGGIFFCQIKSGSQMTTLKMILMK